MGSVRKVAVAGAGRIGGPIVDELAAAGYDVIVLTRDASHAAAKSAKAQIQEVDYESDSSLVEALKGQDALVSTVAMSAIGNQKRMIDAAITAGVKYFIPAEYTVNSRDENAQKQPMMASVVAIQQYLATKGDSIAWLVMNCGALMEFALDHPVLLDFDNQVALLWDGGEGAISLSNTSLLARAVAAVLQQPDRVVNHRLRVHGGTISQKHALELAKKYSGGPWEVKHVESQAAYSVAMQRLQSGASSSQAELLQDVLTAYAAATFGRCDGHFESAYDQPDNGWLGVELFSKGEIEEAIRKRVTVGTYAAQSATADHESLGDVTGDLASTFKRG